ncbi:MAG: CCXG family PEP-CTERM protein [Methylophilaceae bacterium]
MNLMLKKLLLMFMLGFYTNVASAWWDCTWPNRVPVTISNGSAVVLSNYEIQLTINTTSFPGYVFANADNDFRAIDSDDITPLSIFVEPRKLAATSATAWVKIPSLAAGASKTIYIYYAKTGATNVSDAVNTFSQVGVRLWTRNVTVDATSRSSSESAFATATDTVGYGCKIVTDYTTISNQNQFASGSNANIGFQLVSAFSAPVTGNWGFRLGPDFGYGGGMYVDDSIVEEDWNVDMWWNGSFTNTAQTLDNAAVPISTTGYHMLRVFGNEGCCDGAGAMQFKTPSGSYTAWATSNLTLRAPQCSVPNVNITINSATASNFSFDKTVAAYSDPFNNTTNPKYIPGARARYTMKVSNRGGVTDSNSVVVTDAIPANTKLYVGDLAGAGSGPVLFTQGSPSSTISYSFVSLANASDSLSFSNNGGATYTYTPVADANGFDAAVTNIRIAAQGAFACATSSSAATVATFQFDVGIK